MNRIKDKYSWKKGDVTILSKEEYEIELRKQKSGDGHDVSKRALPSWNSRSKMG